LAFIGTCKQNNEATVKELSNAVEDKRYKVDVFPLRNAIKGSRVLSFFVFSLKNGKQKINIIKSTTKNGS
jgi:hypothetical protein